MPSTYLVISGFEPTPPLSASFIYGWPLTLLYSEQIISPYIPPLAGDGDALGVDGALVGVEVEHLILGPRPRSHVQQVAADLQATKSN